MEFINKRKKKEIEEIDIERRFSKYEKKEYIKNYKNSEIIENLIVIAKNMYTLSSFKNEAIELLDIIDKINKPLLVMIMGEFKTGKTTFINAILGEEILKSDVTPATAVVSMLSYGENKKIIAHLSDGSTSEFPYNKLYTLTAEGDEDATNLRSKIKYVEIFIPKKILKNITIIDTPGLNVDNKLHINATRNFMKEADYVYWVFAYGKVASKTEIASIKELSNGIKPVAIVNRIDEVDEEEETVEEVLSEIEKRIKDNISDIIGVSSFLAQKAIKKRDENLLRESNWTEFEEKMNYDLIDNADKLKDKMIKIKVENYIKDIEETMTNRFKKIDTIHDKISNTKRYKKRLVGELKKTELYIRAVRNLESESYMKVNDIDKDTSYDELVAINNEVRIKIGAINGLKIILNKLKDTQRIIETINSFIGGVEEVYHNINLIEEKLNILIEKENLIKNKIKQNDKNIKKYNNSGFFGGAPLLDWHGDAEVLNNITQKLERERNYINRECRDAYRKREVFISRIKSINNQIITYSGNTIKPIIEEKYKELFSELETFDKDSKSYELAIEKLEKENYKIEYLKLKLEEIPKNREFKGGKYEFK